MRELPYLPELESVDTRGSNPAAVITWGMGGMLLPILVFFGYGFWAYHRYFEPGQLALFAIIPALLVIVLLRWLFTYSRVSTSPEGITLSGPLRRSAIPWNSVLRASSKQTSIGRTIIILETNGGRIQLNAGGISDNAVTSARVAASVWQHLRRNGIANDVSLGDRDLSFWQEIGEDVPHDMEWKSSRKRKGTLFEGVAILLMLVVPMIWLLFDDPRLGGFMLVFLSPMLIALMRLISSETIGKVTAGRVTDEAVEVYLPLTTRRVPWDQVVNADWHKGIVLTWHDGARKRIVTIPYEMGKAESENVILAVIRNLRRLPVPPAVPLPELVNRNPEVLRKPVSSNRHRALMRLAFLNTLEPSLRRRMTRLHHLNLFSCLLGLVIAIPTILLDPIGRLSVSLHGAGARFFFVPHTMCLGIPIIMAGVTIFGLLGEWATGRLAGADRETWDQLRKVAPPSKFTTRVTGGLLVLVAASFLLAPLLLDCYWKATDRGIEFSRLWDLEKASYTWSQVKSVSLESYQVNHHGHECARERYLISFSNGDGLLLDDSKAVWLNGRQLPEAIEFICLRSGVRLQGR